jgi:hypothetical protein
MEHKLQPLVNMPLLLAVAGVGISEISKNLKDISTPSIFMHERLNSELPCESATLLRLKIVRECNSIIHRTCILGLLHPLVPWRCRGMDWSWRICVCEVINKSRNGKIHAICSAC